MKAPVVSALLSSLALLSISFSVAAEDICPYAVATMPGKGSLCGAVGNLARADPIRRYTSTTNDRLDCLRTCMVTLNCMTFSYNKKENSCNLYRSTLTQMGYRVQTGSSSTFWDKTCFTTPAQCTPSASGSPIFGSISSTSSSSTTGADPGPTAVQPVDSPPLPSSAVVFPTDKSWTATYTYDEQMLPTFAAAARVVVPPPIDTPTCFIDPTQAGSNFVNTSLSNVFARRYANFYRST
jgi:hypothetical protein